MKRSVLLAGPQEKKHSVRYDAVEPTPLVSTLYVSKAYLPRPFPQQIIVTITTEEEQP